MSFSPVLALIDHKNNCKICAKKGIVQQSCFKNKWTIAEILIEYFSAEHGYDFFDHSY